MEQAHVERIVAHAALSDAHAGLDEAASWAAEGDEDWAAWIDDVERGLALIVRLDVVVEVRHEDGTMERLHTHNDSIWIEKHLDPPKVEEQLRQLAGKDFCDMSRRLHAGGLQVRESDLAEMYVHIVLDRSLREELTTLPVLDRGAELRPPELGHPPDGSPDP